MLKTVFNQVLLLIEKNFMDQIENKSMNPKVFGNSCGMRLTT